MVTIGKIPQKVNSFFRQIQSTVSAHVYAYYCNLVIALCVSHGGTIQRLVARLRNCPHRTGTMNKLGAVKGVFSKRRGEHSVVALVTDDLQASMKKIVSRDLKRWAIEVMIKDQKQHLGLGDDRVWRYRAIVRHLCLVDSAYACLTTWASKPGVHKAKQRRDQGYAVCAVDQSIQNPDAPDRLAGEH